MSGAEKSGYYEGVPKSRVENLRYRKWVLGRALNNVELREGLWLASSEDLLFWVNTFAWTYDPRLPGRKEVPFNTYEFQDEALLALRDAIDHGEPLLIQKSRCMGASWMLVMVFVWYCLFRESCKFLMMSRNADFVDSDDADSLFWKLDFIHKYLPSWMLDESKDVRRLKSKMKVNYLKTGSQITGATTTKSSAIGGRATAVGVDEFSRYDPLVARLLKAGMSPVTNCPIWNFTPNPEMGKSHPSYELVEQASRGEIRNLRMHWREHPVYAEGAYRVDRRTRKVEIIDKGYRFDDYKFQLDGVFEYHSPWFDTERKRVGNDRDIKELYEIDYEGSGYTFFDEMILSEYILQNCVEPQVEGELLYDLQTGKPEKFIIQQGGRIKLWEKLDGFGNLPDSLYVAGVDTSLGVGQSNSCFSLARADTGEKVLMVTTSAMDPQEFAVFCVGICLWTSSARNSTFMAWERNGPGETFGAEIIRLGYSSVYVPPRNSLVWNAKRAETPGWVPSAITKRSLLLSYQSALSTREFLNRCADSMKECYQWMNTRLGPKHKGTLNQSNDPSGAEKNHGDRVIADGLCNKMVQERGRRRMVVAASAKQIRPGMFEWHLQEAERQRKSKEFLYADWSKRRS